MKNELIIAKDGRTFWNSRSMAVTGIIYVVINNQFYFLANKRGDGCPDFQGLWNLPCGYLDYNEDCVEAVIREVKEETSIVLDYHQLRFWRLISNPEQNKQNVTARYFAQFHQFDPYKHMYINPKDLEGGEKNEVEEIKWIPQSEIRFYDWAFDHDEVIYELIDEKSVLMKSMNMQIQIIN